MNSKITCRVCGSTKIEAIFDRLRGDIKRKVLRCKRCDLGFLENIPSQEELYNYYREEYRKNYKSQMTTKGEVAKKYFENKLPLQELRLQKIADIFTPEQNILEVGCAAGSFLHSIKGRVRSVTGVELNVEHAAYANFRGLNVINKPFDEIDFDVQFDVICLFHVLEHIADPIGFLNKLMLLLTSDGC